METEAGDKLQYPAIIWWDHAWCLNRIGIYISFSTHDLSIDFFSDLFRLQLVVWKKSNWIDLRQLCWSTDWTNKRARLDSSDADNANLTNQRPGLRQDVRTDLGVIVTLSY